MKKLLIINILLDFYISMHAMLAPANDQNLWISRKFLWTFLSKNEFKKVGNSDTITMKIAQLQVKDPNTGKTVLKTPKYQFVLDMQQTLFEKGLFEFLNSIEMMCKDEEQKLLDLHMARKAYVHSFALYKTFPRSSWLYSYTMSGDHRYDVPTRIAEYCISYYPDRISYPSVAPIRLTPYGVITIGMPFKFDFYDYGKKGFWASDTKKYYVKKHSDCRTGASVFFRDIGIITANNDSINIFRPELNVTRMEAVLNIMPTLSLCDRVVAHDVLKHGSMHRKPKDQK